MEEKITRKYKGKNLWLFPNDYTVVDIETNVTRAKELEIIEISAVKFRDNRQTDSFSTLVKPKGNIDWFVTKLTGITTAMARKGENIVKTLEKFEEFVGEDILLGYNVNFDVNTIYDAMMKYKNKPLRNDFVDVYRFARRALKDEEIENRKQTTVAKYFDIDFAGAHRAEKDCLICNAIYQKLRTLLKD